MSDRLSSIFGTSLVATIFVAFLMAPATGTSQEIGAGSDIGLGLGWGTFAAGITGKYYMGGGSALQGHLGSSFAFGHGAYYHDHDHHPHHDHHHARGESIGLSIDYVYEPQALVSGSAGRLFWGGGGGGAIFGLGGIGGIAINGVLELGWHFSAVPIELVMDYRPYLAFGSGFADAGFFFPIGFSARFFF